MLFNSYEFLLLFLPICLIGYFQFGRISKNYGAIWLALCSIFFYAWWDYRSRSSDLPSSSATGNPG
jgi:hypothetical protein